MMYDPSQLNIGSEKQLFFDDLVVESAENVCRTWHHPERIEQNPLIRKNQPWEHIPYFTCNTWQVIRDPLDDLFKCWYTDWNKPDITWGEHACGNSDFHILYAESEDGLHWRKPDIGFYEVGGIRTNVVIQNAYDPGLLLDPHEQSENRRFKMVYTQFSPGGDVSAVVAATSADGIHWSTLEERPILGRQGGRLDDVIILNYDPLGRLYLMNTRHYDMYAIPRNLKSPTLNHWTPVYYPADWRRMNKRRIWQSESADLIHWSEPYPILTPEDGEDDLDETFYGLCQFQVGSLFVGFLNAFKYVSNTMDVRLVYSRDGKYWRHANKRQPFLSPHGAGAWDAYMVTIPSKPVVVGGELYVYYGGSSNHHDWWVTGRREGVKAPEATDISVVEYALGLSKLRLDGFVSMDAGWARPGILITRPLISAGTRLIVNARCRPQGSIVAEIVNIHDDVVEGFSRQDCDVFTGDSSNHVFSWRGRTEIPVWSRERARYPEAEVDRFRKIRFYMEDAELYSFSLA